MYTRNKFTLVSIITLAVILVIVVIIALFFYLTRDQVLPVKATLPPPKLAYHLPLDTMEVTYGTVKQNQNLSTILSGYVDPGMIDKIARESAGVFDIRKIKAGNRFARIFPSMAPKRTLYFVYEINPIDFVVFDLTDSLRIYKDQKEIKRTVRTASGTINSSLWNCFVENNLDVGLALALSDVYAWTIDFYGLQKGDNFKVIFEEVYVEGKLIGIDKILSARFSSSGRDFFAYRFEQEGKAEYFDEKGQSLQRSFLKAPLKFSRISSRFSRARMHPILRIARPHFGVDYSAPRGTPVVALGDGRVGEVGYKGGYGKFISIRHNSVYTTTYAHLSGYAKGLKAGVHVRQGEVIGYVGSTGLSTGPHLDFRVYRNGAPTDPLKLESPPSKPVSAVNMKAFAELVKTMNLKLQAPDDSVKSRLSLYNDHSAKH
jgi:murein DD-endopeptidase MepM/ murein hydrolase activator NlpD